MFRWPNIPSPEASPGELADFAELICWRQGNVSSLYVQQALGRVAENVYSDGVPEEEISSVHVSNAILQVEQRSRSCRGGYPFEVSSSGNSIRSRRWNLYKSQLIYRFLLLSTRLNMRNNRFHGGLDGTVLFEWLSADIAKAYFGPRGSAMVFGTGAGAGDFPARIDLLCKRLEEGRGYSGRGSNAHRKKDDRLDVVVWTPFADRRESKLIGFGQCKTGTSWERDITQMQPDAFCKKWFKEDPVVTPVRMFFVSEAISDTDWATPSIDAGLLFDRCRIVDFCHDVSGDVLADVKRWTDAAARANQLPTT